MRVLFPDISQPKAGKGFFLNALKKEFGHKDIDVVFGDAEHDISLHNVRIWKKTKKPKILRLDNIYYNTAQNWQAKNASIAESVKKSDGIICQSIHAFEMCKRFVGVQDADIIFNGASTNQKVYRIDNKNEKVFISVSKWRPHKRLLDIVESFLLASIENSVLYIVGDTTNSNCNVDKYKTNRRIVFCGPNLPREVIFTYMSNSTAMIHLCRHEACPNAVVEALCLGCPVICNNTGGTHEIVRPSGGMVLDVDPVFDYKPCDLYHPPAIDRNQVAKAMVQMSTKRPVVKNWHVDIKNIADQYINCFRKYV